MLCQTLLQTLQWIITLEYTLVGTAVINKNGIPIDLDQSWSSRRDYMAHTANSAVFIS